MELPLEILRNKCPKLADTQDWNAVESALFASLQIGDYEWTQFCLQRLRQKFPGSLRVAKAAAVVKEATDANSATADFRQLLQKAPEDPWIRKRLACLLKNQGKFDEAVKFLGEQSVFFSSDPEIFHEQAMLQLLYYGSIPKCTYLFEEVLLSQPENIYNLITYGELQCSLGEWEIGRKYFSFALRLKPDDLRALWLLLISITKSKKNQSGSEILRDLARETKTRISQRYNSGECGAAAAAVLASVEIAYL